MTVSELISLLKEHDPNSRVIAPLWKGRYGEVEVAVAERAVQSGLEFDICDNGAPVGEVVVRLS
jgi:hypothetical protein